MSDILQKWFFRNDDKKDHTKALDGLRGIAVIMVLLSHSSNNGLYLLQGLRFNGIGIGGVYLFFMLSAYLLDRQIAFAMRQYNADVYFWKRYFVRRFLRIYPLFFIALLCFLCLSTIGLTTCVTTGNEIVLHLLLQDGCSIFWSIPVEFKYYFISPLILCICHYFLKWDLMKTGLFLMSLAVFFLVGDWIFNFNKISMFKYLVVFLPGTFMAIFNLLHPPENQDWPLGKYIWPAGFIALLLSLFLNENYVGNWMGYSTSNLGRKSMLIYAVLCGIMLYTALYDTRYFKKFLENKGLRFIGVISYSIYLFHLPVLLLLREKIIQVPPWAGIYVFLGGTISLSLITYFLVERPLALIQIPKNSPSGPDPFP